MKTQFNFPTRYRLGPGRIAELPGLCLERGIRRPLVVTDPGVSKLPWFSEIVDALHREGLDPATFADVHVNPTGRDVKAGVACYRASDCDGVVMVGGGSAMDAAKCIALMVENEGSVFDYVDEGDNWTRVRADKIPPMLAVPTTAGTGSEVGRASVIIDSAREKKIIFHPALLPPDVIADPELTYGLPPHLTAFTGVDAYVHCFEAFCASGYHPMADGIALEGMRLIKNHLPTAVREGDNAEARTHMIMASTMGATAFQKGLGVVHAISHALGGKLDVHHGLANAILLPYCMVFNRSAIEERCGVVARHLDLTPSFDALLKWTVEFREQLKVPHSLKGVKGLEPGQFGLLADVALSDAALGGNPKPTTRANLVSILDAALRGEVCS